MGRHTRRIAAVLAVALLASVFASQAIATAQAEYPPAPPTPGDLVVPPTVQVHGEIAVSGNSCGANQSVTISFNGVPVTTVTSDTAGHFTASFPVPVGTTPGVYSITASNAHCVLSGVIQVEAVTAAKLAFTGSSNSIPTVWVGVGLVALGAGLAFVARRRLSGAVR